MIVTIMLIILHWNLYITNTSMTTDINRTNTIFKKYMHHHFKESGRECTSEK